MPTVIAVVMFAGCFLRVRQRWFIPGMSGFGYDTWVVQSTLDGNALAPNQYRLLMPWVDRGIAALGGLPLPTAILVADLLLLALAVWLLDRLCRRLGRPEMILLAAGVWSYWVAKLDHWHPEVMFLTAAVVGATLLLLERRPSAPVLLAIGLITCGARTDYAAGLGLVMLAVGHRRRLVPLAAAGGVVLSAAITATFLLTEILYPQARYQVALVQLPFNLGPGVVAMVLAFYGAVLLLPALFLGCERTLPPLSFAIGWFAIEFAATFVVGRVEESRIFLPFAPVLAIAAGCAWLGLRRSGTWTDSEEPSEDVGVVARRRRP